MAKTKMTRIGDVLPSVLRRLGLEQRFREQAVLNLWADVVGPEIAARTRASRIDKGVLHIRVDHGAWIQELHFIEKDLLRKLRAAAPGVELQRIRFSAREH
jgi:predicted nucleic acid-binding Zn ribbon protein